MNKKFKIVITDYISNPHIEQQILGKDCKIICLNEENENCFPDSINDADILLVWHAGISKKTIEKLKSCKAIIRYGVGFDNVDIKCAAEYGIPFANNPDYGVHEVADTTCALILSHTRGIPFYNNSNLINCQTWQKNTIKGLHRSTDHSLGIIGLGRIGTAVALRMKAFGMRIGFYDPFLKVGHEKSYDFIRYGSIDELLKSSTILSIHCPLNNQSRSMIDETFIKKLNDDTILINTARGKIIKNLDIIYEGLKSGKIKSIGLDVLPDEPPPNSEYLIKTWHDKNNLLNSRIIITPHTSYYSDNAWVEMRQKIAITAKDALQGKPLVNLILPD
tara:strand:+ start:1095 stop:2093 length:999 start_codon:yes stop_codon:yes gene_type:complete